MKGNVLVWASSGLCGFKGARKGTPFAAKTAVELALKKSIDFGVKQAQINVAGVGSGRELAIRSVQNSGISIFAIKDVTKLPHNGCRPSKKRRV